MPINEWELTADVASWINEIIGKDRTLPFSRAKCEQRPETSLKRRDLTLLGGIGQILVTGEIKLPYQKDGSSPYNAVVVDDARSKALKVGSKYFFTWNVNECVLWETTPTRSSWRDQNYKSWDVTKVRKESDLEHPAVIDAIKNWLPVFLNDLAKILGGTSFIGRKSPDEKFIDALESALKMPIFATLDELERRYKKVRNKSELDKWMRSDQGWIIYDDPEGIRENLERAARFACYGLLNKLVFHEALLRRYGAQIDKISIPEHIDTGEDLRSHVEGYFAEAIRITGDYETVFGEDHTAIGNRIPFYPDVAVPYWRDLIGQIHEFDFSKLDYEVIGNIFERLISPEERHKYGQFYTRVEVVDLINSFCIRTGHEKVLDPACGGGTFLVRAYARKRELSPNRKHSQLLSDLFGVDISHFATHLTTINLATRDLIDQENYPQIARTDFFDIETRRAFMRLPKRILAKGLGQPHYREIEIPPLDAVVGNPPYIRQEEIPSGKKNGSGAPANSTKGYYQQLVKREAGIDLSGRSDIHCYFWPHATSFLKKDGYLCLLTSSQWLDVEYGFRLQEWILRNFEIAAVFESIDEPWFVGARVATTVTILRRQEDTAQRMQNTVRFVQLRRPMAEILSNDGTMAGAVNSSDALRDEILSLVASTVNDRYRARLVNQGDLWREGVQLGLIMGKSKYSESGDPEQQDGDYYGGKWGMYLRAPDLWFELLDNYR
ncbi:MAG: N-6 DNA methylase, partial [Syntrophobacteraceae bacterium]